MVLKTGILFCGIYGLAIENILNILAAKGRALTNTRAFIHNNVPAFFTLKVLGPEGECLALDRTHRVNSTFVVSKENAICIIFINQADAGTFFMCIFFYKLLDRYL